PNGITPEEYGNVPDFLNEVQTSTGARDLDRIADKKGVDFEPATLRYAESGDLILLYYPTIHHVQVVTFASPLWVNIVQGNTEGSGSSNPRSDDYVGQPVKEWSYVFERASGKWIYKGEDGFKVNYGRLRIWSFAAWNQRIKEYTVKNGDTIDT